MTFDIPSWVAVAVLVWTVVGGYVGYREGRQEAKRVIAGPVWDVYLQEMLMHIALAPLALGGVIHYRFKWKKWPWTEL